jgi:DNA-binding MarR family transcriptional regulator
MASIDEEIKSKFETDHQRAVVNILFTANWLKNLHSDALKKYDITTQQYNILRILRGAKDWMAMNDVKGRMIEKSPNTTRLADKLITTGFIERRRCEEDRRVVFVQITKKGLDLLKQMDGDKHFDWSDGLLKNLTKKEAKKMSLLLDQLRG